MLFFVIILYTCALLDILIDMASALKFVKSNPFALATIMMIVYTGFAFYTDIGHFSNTEIKIDYWMIPLALALISVNALLLGFRFHRFLRALSIDDIPLTKSILLYITGLSLSATPASSGQIVKSYVIKKQFGHSISKTSPIILVEKWNELISALIILIIFNIIHRILESTLIIMIGIGIAIFLFGIMKSHRFFLLFKRIISKFKRFKILEESIESSKDALKSLFSKRIVLEGVIITLPALFLQAISVFITFHALGINVDFITSTQIFYTALISGILSFIPGGLGIAEGSMIALLHKYQSGYDLARLAGAVIFVRLITLWYPAFLGIITARFVMKYNNTNGV
jgi:glycosyltransferase 2 family protein